MVALGSRAAPTAALLSFAKVRGGPLWRTWQALAAEAPPFLCPEFFALDRALAGPGEALVGVALDGDRLVGALPLLLEGRHLRALQSPHQPGYDFVGNRQALAPLLRALLDAGGWDRLDLLQLAEDSVLAAEIPALAAAAGCPVATRPGALQRRFALPGFAAALSHHFLVNLRRCERKAGGVVHERLTSPSRADFAEALALESSGWKSAAGTDLGSDRHAAHLYRCLLRLFGPRGRATLHFLRVGGRRVAMLIAVEQGATLYALKIGHDVALGALGLGHLMIWKAAEEAERRGLLTLDFVGRDDEWKRRWTDVASEHLSLLVYRRSPLGLLAYERDEEVVPQLRRLVGDLRHPFARHCQQDDLVGIHPIGERVRGRVNHGFGIRSGLRRALTSLGRHPPHLGAPSQFPVGSWVRVRSAEELGPLLDARRALRGLVFVPVQWQTCGQVYRVQADVRRMRDDAGRLRPVARTVLLEGVDCSGPGPEPTGCGRHCPLLYRDEWLEPAAPPRRTPPAADRRPHARVRDLAEIRAGLDAWGRRDGVTFMPEMARHADQRFAIAGTLERVFELDRWVSPPRPLYLLDGLHCGGEVTGSAGPCQRACALLWHPDWLIVESPA